MIDDTNNFLLEPQKWQSHLKNAVASKNTGVKGSQRIYILSDDSKKRLSIEEIKNKSFEIIKKLSN